MSTETQDPPDGYVLFTREVRPDSASELLKAIARGIDDGLSSMEIWITCVGGNVQTCLALHRTLLALPVELRTHNTAQITGVGNLLFISGNRRTAAADTRFRFIGLLPSEEDEEDVPPSWIEQRKRVVHGIAARTHMTVDNVENLKVREANLKADEALALGLISAIEDPVIEPKARVFVV